MWSNIMIYLKKSKIFRLFYPWFFISIIEIFRIFVASKIKYLYNPIISTQKNTKISYSGRYNFGKNKKTR